MVECDFMVVQWDLIAFYGGFNVILWWFNVILWWFNGI